MIIVGLALGCEATEVTDLQLPAPEAQLERWVEMWNSYDLDEVKELFLDDPRVTYFSSEKEGVIRGMEAVLEHHRGFGFVPGGDTKSTRLWLEGLNTDLFGEVAVVTGFWFFQSEGEPAGVPQKGPVTFVSVWDSDRWRFVHMNFSDYLSPDSL